MRLSQIVNVRRVAASGAVVAMLWCGQARADVLEQVPSDAVGVVKIKSLEGLNAKVAKMAKTFGLDELQPEMKDPLGALLEKGHMSKGLNKSGDAALAMFAPEKGEKEEPVAVALVPVSDYDAFVGNFKKAEGGGGEITAVEDPEGAGKTMFIAHRGGYAVLSDKKEHLSGHGGIKLSAAAAHEADIKDAIFFFNMPVIREKAITAIKKDRSKWMKEMDKNLGEQEPLKKFVPVFDTVVNKALDSAEEFLNSANVIMFSVNITDAGMSYGGLVDMAPDSKMGKTVADLKPGGVPLLSGLPDHRYFLFAGTSIDPKVTTKIAEEWIDPIVKDLKNTDTPIGKQLAGLLETGKSVLGASNHSAVGWLVPTKPLGQDSLFQQVSVMYGDAKTIAAGEKKLLGDVNDLMALAPQNAGAKTKIEFGEVKTIDGVELQSYATKLEFDPNDPKSMQAQQIMGMLYGPKGQVGSFGAVNDHVFIVTAGVDDELLKELIASAKGQKDVLGESAGVKAVASQLPGNRSVVYYVALDNIVSTAVRYAQGFGLPIKMKLPQNLPPIGIAAGSEGSTFRVDAFVPTETVQSLIAAGIQAYTQMQGGAGGGL
jgi:hypothetical protein